MLPCCHREEPASRIQMQLERGPITDKKSKRVWPQPTQEGVWSGLTPQSSNPFRVQHWIAALRRSQCLNSFPLWEPQGILATAREEYFCTGRIRGWVHLTEFGFSYSVILFCNLFPYLRCNYLNLTWLNKWHCASCRAPKASHWAVFPSASSQREVPFQHLGDSFQFQHPSLIVCSWHMPPFSEGMKSFMQGSPQSTHVFPATEFIFCVLILWSHCPGPARLPQQVSLTWAAQPHLCQCLGMTYLR